MQRIHEILNALATAFGQEMVKEAVRGWIGMKDAEEFLAANPGLRFTNEGVDPRGGGAALCATASGLDATASGLDAAPSGYAGGGAGLCHTPNASGRYSLYSGIPDGTPYDEISREDTAKALLSLASASDVDPEVTAVTEGLAGLAVASSSGQ
jgi:hypothetical protein